MKNVATKNLTNYYNGEVFHGVEIVDEDDLPRGCGEPQYILDEDTMERYAVYKDCVTSLLYAILDE